MSAKGNFVIVNNTFSPLSSGWQPQSTISKVEQPLLPSQPQYKLNLATHNMPPKVTSKPRGNTASTVANDN